MDDNAQSQPVPQNSFRPADLTSNVAKTVVDEKATASSQPPAPIQAPSQPASISGRSEQGVAASFETDDDDLDTRQTVAREEISGVTMSHPEVVLAPELKDAGVVEGKDANINDLPEEKQEVAEETVQAVGQSTTQQAGDANLPMSYGEAQLAAKKERSIKNGVTWIIRLVIREWKKKFQQEL